MRTKRVHAPLPRSARSQRGATSVVVALFLVVAVAALGAIDVGNIFFARRSLQRIADLAALAGVQTIGGGCAQATSAATANAAANDFSASASGQALNVVCGRWDTKTNSAPSYFASTNAGTPLNAIQVTATRQVPFFFLGPARTISATATAQATNLGAFTVGTALAQLNGGLVNGMLNALLGTNLSLDVVSYESLASARIKIGDLMAAVGVGTVDELLSTKVSVAELAQYMATALSRTSVVDANLQADQAALQAIVNGGISDTVQFPLGNTSGTPGLLSLGVSDSQSAINATISPFDALVVAAEIAQAGQGAISINGGLNLPLVATTLSAQIIQPPVLAVGEAGQDPATGTWRTQASAAQVRLYIDLNLGTPADLPLLNVNLPLAIEVAQGQAWLESTDCTGAEPTSTSVIGAQTGLASLCVAKLPAALPPASQAFSCPATPATLVNVLGLVTVTADIFVPVESGPVPLTFHGTQGGYQSVNSNDLGAVLVNTLSSGNLQVNVLGIGLSAAAVESALASLFAATLAPIVDNTVAPLLQLLGVQVGVTTIHDLSLTCGVSKLVY